MLPACFALMLSASSSALAISFKMTSAVTPCSVKSLNSSRIKLVLPEPRKPATIRSGFLLEMRLLN